MKRYKDLKEEILNEGGYRYPGDDMTMKELKIAINAAKNILDMLEDGASIQRWQISAIVVASEELASVCTSMRADYEEEMEDEYENEVVAYEYPWMGEEVELDEEMDFKVSVEGLPDMYVKAKSPTEVKQNLRKIVKKPDMIQSVDRVTQSMMKKIFRDKAAGKEDMEEASDVDESSFVAKAAHAKVAGKKSFKLKGSDKEHPVTIGHNTAKKIKKAISEEIELDEASHYIKKIHTAKGPEWAVIPKGSVKPVEVFKSEKEAEKYISEKDSK